MHRNGTQSDCIEQTGDLSQPEFVWRNIELDHLARPPVAV